MHVVLGLGWVGCEPSCRRPELSSATLDASLLRHVCCLGVREKDRCETDGAPKKSSLENFQNPDFHP